MKYMVSDKMKNLAIILTVTLINLSIVLSNVLTASVEALRKQGL